MKCQTSGCPNKPTAWKGGKPICNTCCQRERRFPSWNVDKVLRMMKGKKPQEVGVQKRA